MQSKLLLGTKIPPLQKGGTCFLRKMNDNIFSNILNEGEIL